MVLHDFEQPGYWHVRTRADPHDLGAVVGRQVRGDRDAELLSSVL